ncbi:MAG: nuclear transport factor 2 family protein [Rhodospirillum sp.]|nr:nuclear transport factor 2 family protein [Rhodospirillum sp.]
MKTMNAFKARALTTSAFAMGLAAVSLTGGLAYAGDGETAARAHIDAIAKGDVNGILASYGDGAVLHWVGGPLDGTHHGDGLSTVWRQFTKAQGVLKAEVGGLREEANPAGTTVSANVVFQGQKTLPVYYVMLFRGGKLVDEVWQISPNMTAY